MAAPMARQCLQRTRKCLLNLSMNSRFTAITALQNAVAGNFPRVPLGTTSASQFLQSNRFFSTNGVIFNSNNNRFSTSAAISSQEEEPQTDTVSLVNDSLSSPDLGRLFAVIHIRGHQRKVTQDDLISVQTHLAADVGERIRLEKVMLVGGKDFTLIGRPLLRRDLVKVEATVIEKTLSNVRVSFFYKRRKDHKRLKLYTNSLTILRINSIEVAPLANQ